MQSKQTTVSDRAAHVGASHSQRADAGCPRGACSEKETTMSYTLTVNDHTTNYKAISSVQILGGKLGIKPDKDAGWQYFPLEQVSYFAKDARIKRVQVTRLERLTWMLEEARDVREAAVKTLTSVPAGDREALDAALAMYRKADDALTAATLAVTKEKARKADTPAAKAERKAERAKAAAARKAEREAKAKAKAKADPKAAQAASKPVTVTNKSNKK